MITHGLGKETLSTEIEKCAVLCANCHRQKHYEVPDFVGEIEVMNGVVRVE